MVKGQQKLVVCLLCSLLMAGCRGGLPPEPSLTPSSTPHLQNTPTQLPSTVISSTAAGLCPSPQEWSMEFQREGGIKGVSQLLNVSSDGNVQAQDLPKGSSFSQTLDPPQTQEIENLLVQACPFETQKTAKTCADCFVYSLSIQMDGEMYRVKVMDTSIPETLQPLIGYLNRLLQQTIAP
jgi:hypothetical protein